MRIDDVYIGRDECCKYCECSSVSEMEIDPDSVDDNDIIVCNCDNPRRVKAGAPACMDFVWADFS